MIDEKTPRTGSDQLVFSQVCSKLRRKVNIFILIYNFDEFLTCFYSYPIYINNYDEHLKNKIN